MTDENAATDEGVALTRMQRLSRAPRPTKARLESRRGRPARWSPEALARARKIRKPLARGFTLAAIEQRLADG